MHSMPLRFSDGTLVTLAAASRARVVRTTARGADIVLEQGSLGLAVVHHAGGEWHVGAGPFTVLVTGTKFEVGWNAAERSFTLALHEGSVQVRGPTLSGGGRWVKPGEVLRVVIDDHGVAVAGDSASPSPVPPVSPGVAEATAPPDAEPVSPVDSASRTPKSVRGAALGSWKELALKERYPDALAAAEAEGFDATCRAASAKDLVLLGNAARFAGSGARAEQAFRQVRSRFAGSHEASMAAFFLGRIAYDQQGNRREAARWFQSYLLEEPAGGLAREASGRLLEAQRALGDREAYRASARAYLERYPSGPHAGLARELLKP
jgi:transmembrane sensor